ncbi:MAG TPA: hypothetical protein VKT28_12350 [Puia sp.]|nr:hypothetical protein [Puia sp.]
MTTDDPIFHKPEKFIAAKKLLYASIFLSIINVIINNIRVSVHSRFLFLSWLVAAIVYIVIFIIIKQMGLCKKWARTVLAVWLGLDFLVGVISFFNPLVDMSILEIAIWTVKVILQAIAFIFLYSRDCQNWFNSKKYEMFGK